MDNVTITAHYASATLISVEMLRSTAANIVVIACHGQKLPNIVNGVNA
jgi:lactate dehydrogenase-like 2-hydroxyacid dehydrogenase